MRGLAVSGIIIGVVCSAVAAILVLSGGKIIAVAEGWSRAATMAFLFSIAISLVPEEEPQKGLEEQDRKEKPEQL